jgi:hypothetical protein
MKRLFVLWLLAMTILFAHAETRTIHIFVPLCDNVNQGIVPVPKTLGNGQDPKNNLYWGAAYGVKSYFKYKTKEWTLVKSLNADQPEILERILFKHATKDIYMLADAYDGAKIKACTEDFLLAANEQQVFHITHDAKELAFGGGADLLAYTGHDGLMDFDVNISYHKPSQNEVDVIILACFSKSYFAPEIRKAGATPILWTTHLMAPEAYTLKAAIDGWILNESGDAIDERAAQMYHRYQKCGIKGARGLFTTGF